jgi:hypothetical protein
VHGSVHFPQAFEGHDVAGVQHVFLSAFEHCSPLAQVVAQSTVWPVHAALKDPQNPEGHVRSGVQHVLASEPPATPHCSPLAHVVLQVNVVPLHGSFHVAPQYPDGQPVAGVQHVLSSAFEQTSPAAQFDAQLTIWPVHGSVKDAHEPAGHVFCLQHVLASEPPATPHCSPLAHVVLQVKVVPLHGSFHVAPQ